MAHTHTDQAHQLYTWADNLKPYNMLIAQP